MTIVKTCENLQFGRFQCHVLYNCCSCGDNDCGCAYCFDCKACDNCKEGDSE